MEAFALRLNRKKQKPMAQTVRLNRVGSGNWSPATAFDFEALDSKPSQIEVEIYPSPRSTKHQRFYRAVIGEMAKQQDGLSPDALHQITKMECGFVDVIRLPDGASFAIAKSTAFDAMDQSEFKVFFDKAIEFLARKFGCDPLSIYNQSKAKFE